jgi:hypothetical protein
VLEEKHDTSEDEDEDSSESEDESESEDQGDSDQDSEARDLLSKAESDENAGEEGDRLLAAASEQGEDSAARTSDDDRPTDDAGVASPNVYRSSLGSGTRGRSLIQELG